MLKAISDYCIFIGIVFFICAVISYVIMKVRTDKIIKGDESLRDLTTFYKKKWNNKKLSLTGQLFIVIVPDTTRAYILAKLTFRLRLAFVKRSYDTISLFRSAPGSAHRARRRDRRWLPGRGVLRCAPRPVRSRRTRKAAREASRRIPFEHLSVRPRRSSRKGQSRRSRNSLLPCARRQREAVDRLR